MAQQIIKQPNGKYCIYCSVEEWITSYDLDIADLIEIFTTEAISKTIEEVKNITNSLEKGDKPYKIFTYTFEDVFKQIEAEHGKQVTEVLKSQIIK